MNLPVRSITTRAVSTSLSLATTAVRAGVGVVRHVPVVSTVAGKAKDVATLGITTAATQGMAAVAKVRGVPTQREQAAAVETALDPFSLPVAVADLVDDAAPGATLAHADLPLEDYDHLTIGSLRARIRRLDAPALIQLRDYERAHGNRLPVLMAFDNRLKTLATQTPGAEQATLVTV